MRTLVQSGFMAQGIRPRVFVRVFDSSGNDILLQGTKAVGSYEDRVTTFGAINQSIKPDGGMAEVSGASVNRLVLDERLTLCTEASLDPQFQSGVRGAGCIYSRSPVYYNGRNAISGTFNTQAVVVGRNCIGVSPLLYIMYRGYLQFLIPAALATCEDAYIQLSGILPLTGSPTFTIYGMGGTWTDLATGGPIFNDFVGWKPSDDYDISENWIESWTTDEFGATVYLRLNAKGRTAIVAAAGSPGMKWFRIMFISDSDADYTGHPTGSTGEEYAPFTAETAKLVLRYNSKTLDNQPVEILYGLEPLPATISGTTLDRVWTGVVDSWELNDRELTLTAKQNDHKKNPLLPSKIINTTAWPDCPEENIGKAYPIVFGDLYPTDVPHGTHEDGIGIDSAGGITGLRDYAPALIVKPWGGSYEKPGKILVAGHAVLNSYTGLPAFWNSSRKTFERMWAQFSALKTASDGSIYFEYYPLDRPLTDGSGLVISHHDFIGHAFSVIPSRIVRYDAATDPEKAYSNITAEYATLNGAGAYIDFGFDQKGAFAEREQVEAVFDLVMVGSAFMTVGLYNVDTELNVSGSDGQTTADSFLISASSSFLDDGISEDDLLVIMDGINAGEWPIQEVIDDHTLDLQWLLQVATGQSFKVLKRGALLENIGAGSITASGQKIFALTYFTDDPLKYVIRLTQTSGTGSWQIKNLQVRIYSPDDEKPDMVFLDKQGAKYGSWITGRGFTSGYLIENPAGAIEGLARNELPLVTAEIDIAAFDAAATAVTGKKLAFQEGS